MAAQSRTGEEAPPLQRALRRGSCPWAERDGAGFAKCPAQKGGRRPQEAVFKCPQCLPFQRNRRGAPQTLGKEETRVKWSGEVAGAGKRVGKRQLPRKETEAGRMEE